MGLFLCPNFPPFPYDILSPFMEIYSSLAIENKAANIEAKVTQMALITWAGR